MVVRVQAPAKINLTLHITGQREDGYHLLDSLVIFGNAADQIIVEDSDTLSLTVTGPQADQIPENTDNLVMQATRLMARGRGARITLIKTLPVASGIGGGSADAAATLRALSKHWGDPLPGIHDVLSLGADVPVCLGNNSARMRGIGEILSPVCIEIEKTCILLINPRVSVSTQAVFRQLKDRNHPPMPDSIPAFRDTPSLAMWLKWQRNDLEETACRIQPVIGDVLEALRDTGCLIARMSGSGATCFGLYDSPMEAHSAKIRLQNTHPHWWID